MRSSLSLSLSLLLCTLTLSSYVTARQYTLYHRLSPSSGEFREWTVRGSVDILPSASVGEEGRVKLVNSVGQEEWEAFKQSAEKTESKAERYEIAVRQDGQGVKEDEDVKTFVPLCHLRQSSPHLPALFDTFSFNLRNDTLFSLSYTIRDIQLDAGGCPIPSQTKLKNLQEFEKREKAKRKAGLARLKRLGRDVQHLEEEERVREKNDLQKWRSQVVVRTKERVMTPLLRAPPPTKQDGTIREPEPEKSFIQKYWFYIVPMLLVMLLPGGEEKSEAGAAETQVQSQGQGARRLN